MNPTMAVLSSKIKNNIDAMSVAKVNDAKRAATELKEILERDDAIKLLNTLSKDPEEKLTWNELFRVTHITLIQYVDRPKGKGPAWDNSVRLFKTLLKEIVKSGNSDEAYIHCNHIIDAIVFILKTQLYSESVGDLYIDILQRYVLPFPAYWITIGLENWEALYEIGWELIQNKVTNCSSAVIIATLETIIRRGCEHTSFMLLVKKRIFDDFRKLFLNLDETIQLCSQKLLATISDILKKECRFAICKFSEEIISKLLNMNKSRIVDKKKEYMIEFLLIAMECHHPNGVTEGSDSMYAYNREEWNRILQKLIYYVNNELEYQSQVTKNQVLNVNFLKLIVEIYNQVFHKEIKFVDVTIQSMNESFGDTDRFAGNKRRRLGITCSFSEMINRLNQIDKPIELWPWLSVISSLLETYPELMNNEKRALLLKNISVLVSASKEPVIKDYLYKCCISIINIYEIQAEPSINSDENKLWDIIWNSVLRTIGLNQNVEWSHKLIQRITKFIQSSHKRDSLLQLYLKHEIKISEASVMTLYNLRLLFAFPINSTLLQWLFPISNTSKEFDLLNLPIQNLAHLAILLCLKNNVKNIPKFTKPTHFDDHIKREFFTASQIHSLIEYKQNIFLQSEKMDNQIFAVIDLKANSLDEDAYKTLYDILSNFMENLIEYCDSLSDPMIRIHCICSGLLLLLYILKFEVDYDIRAADIAPFTDLLCKVNEYFSQDMTTLFQTMENEENLKIIIKLYAYMSSFFQHMWYIPIQFSTNILNEFDQRLVKAMTLVENITESNANEFGKKCFNKDVLLKEEKLSEYDRIRFEAIKFLIYYSYHSEGTGTKQLEVIDKLSSTIDDMFQNECDHDLMNICVHFTRIILKLEDVTDELFGKALKLMKYLCENGDSKWIKMTESAAIILDLNLDFIKATHRMKNESNWPELKSVIQYFEEKNKKCGVSISNQIIRNWGAFLEIDVYEVKDIKSESIMFLLDCCYNITNYLKNDFHEVRLMAMNFISKMFKLIDVVCSNQIILKLNEGDQYYVLTKSENVVNNFKSVLFGLFIVDNLNNDKLDEEFKRPASVFYALATAICGSMKFRRELLFLLFEITHEKKLNQSVASKVLNMIREHFRMHGVYALEFLNDNIRYIFMTWFDKYKKFDSFPHQILNCSTLNEFYEMYTEHIMVVYIFYADANKLNELGDILKKPFISDLLIKYFPDVISTLLNSKLQKYELPSIKDREKMYEFVVKSLTKKEFHSLAVKKLTRILITIIDNFQDPANIDKFTILPKSTPLSTDYQTTNNIINLLQECIGCHDHVLLYAAKEHRSVLPEILQDLYAGVVNASTCEIRLVKFHQYLFISNILVSQYEKLTNLKMVAFITFIIIHHVLNFLSLEFADNLFKNHCLLFFCHFLTKCIKNNHNLKDSIITKIISICLNGIVEKLIMLIESCPELREMSFKILSILVIDCGDTLKMSLITLHKFPETEEFDKYRSKIKLMSSNYYDNNGKMTVNNVVRFFLLASDNSPNSPCLVESLKFLCNELHNRKEEIAIFFKSTLVKKSTPEDYLESDPHRIICTLVKQTKSESPKVRQEAINCLCEIGLVDLQSFFLQPNHEFCRGDTDSKCVFIHYIIEVLKDCLTDGNIKLTQTAFQIMKFMFVFKDCYHYYSEKLNSVDSLIFFPFLPESGRPKIDHLWSSYFKTELFQKSVNNEEIWSIENISYNAWICNLVSAICRSFQKSCFIYPLGTICELKVSAAPKMFKYLVNFLTQCKSNEPIRIIGDRINNFLENSISNVVKEDSNNYLPEKSAGEHINNDISATQCLLDAIDFIRLNQNDPDKNILNVNYFVVAKAALQCSAYFTAILYAELYVHTLIGKYDIYHDGNIISYLEEVESRESNFDHCEILNLLREAFSKIGDSDALYGCASPALLNFESRISHYQQTENWQRVFESCETNLAINPSNNSTIFNFSVAMENLGYYNLHSKYLTTVDQKTAQLKDAHYNCAWKLGKWDFIEPCDDEKTYSYYQYAALKELNQQNDNGVNVNVECAKLSLVPSVAEVCLESTKNIYLILTKLQCLQEIKDVLSIMEMDQAINKWKLQDDLSKNLNFCFKEKILNQRIRLADPTELDSQMYTLKVAKKARKDGNYNFANSCLALIRSANTDGETFKSFNKLVRFEEAQLLWAQKETYTARIIVRDMLNKNHSSNLFYANLLETYGRWLAEMNLENADKIFDEYLLKAVKIIEEKSTVSHKDNKIKTKSFTCVAEFADKQYQQIDEYTKSESYEFLAQNAQNLDELKGAGSLTSRARIMTSNQSKIATSEVAEVKRKKESYLELAFKYYLQVLVASEENDLKIFRVVSFWLHNKNNANINLELKKMIKKIPSYKFILVLPQLLAHLTCHTAEGFGNILNQIMEKCIQDHPHHTLPLLFSMANYTRDQEYFTDDVTSNQHPEDRVNAAKSLIKKFKSTAKLKKIINEMEMLNEAYIEFAYLEESTFVTGTKHNLSKDTKFYKISNFTHIYCPTIEVPINMQCQYDNTIGVRKMLHQFSILTGLSKPKRISILCTDGTQRMQLVKGKDDLRGDAVMEQVFRIMNKLLMENKHTSKRELLLRTYKVVPLSQRSGVIEFCTGTMSINDYLINKENGAYPRLRPSDLPIQEARKIINAELKSNDEIRKKVYLKVCSRLQPVFRYFFLENFHLPVIWFERKLAYVHSVATSSMVGYILGIGDRHGQNILIDTKSAELIHIDFGIVFDQGMYLNTPETVPFRLTRNIEDGMGILSLDGVFRRCCEKVMDVLRTNSEIIRTTTEVFIHDPLYMWTLNDQKKKSSKAVGDINVNAGRAISRLKLKLQGMEEGVPTNTEGQVNRLIQQAKDVNNLSKLFTGWQAYL